MTLQEYLDHYLVWQDMLKFLLIALGALMGCILVIIIFVRAVAAFASGGYKKSLFSKKALNAVQRFYDIIFSGASILSFLSIFYLIDRFVEAGEFRDFWDAHKDFILLLMIVLSIVFNNILDRILVPLRKITRSEMASVRLAGMLYVILIFIYIKYVYENNNYDGFIMYFLGLMVGRFVYFDVSFRESLKTLKDGMMQIPIMIMGLGCTAFMCYIGFGSKYLLISNGVLVSTFIAHIFLIAGIFIIHHSHIVLLFTGGRYKGDD
ncbi:MAG: hypothetical protein K5888_05275 [Lachnospiraceae bacterium]|nr:hypothetical protein [Lachnospiraceae bacterium]